MSLMSVHLLIGNRNFFEIGMIFWEIRDEHDSQTEIVSDWLVSWKLGLPF